MLFKITLLSLVTLNCVRANAVCPPLYIIEKCNNEAIKYRYELTPSLQSWSASRSVCQNLGGDLIVVGAKDFAARKKIFSELPDVWIWIGLHDPERDGSWEWLDGSQDNIHWAPNEPNNFKSYSEYCGEVDLTRLYKTNDYSCYANLRGLCEIPMN
ncbi:C-type lectin lectoxin-Phi1-like [Clavelina lepadiformis]|uniref:C-type lectin lectoxin-Phi1-like n=1 Tax=Clavelina lepadiformis TaxID=159417 RepID=UPI004041D979